MWSSGVLFSCPFSRMSFLILLAMKGKAFLHKGRNSCFLAKSIAKSYMVGFVFLFFSRMSFLLLSSKGKVFFHKGRILVFLRKSIANSYIVVGVLVSSPFSWMSFLILLAMKGKAFFQKGRNSCFFLQKALLIVMDGVLVFLSLFQHIGTEVFHTVRHPVIIKLIFKMHNSISP